MSDIVGYGTELLKQPLLTYHLDGYGFTPYRWETGKLIIPLSYCFECSTERDKVRHSDSVGSGKGEDSRNYDTSRRDQDDQTLTSDDVEQTEETEQTGNPSTVDESDNPSQ